MNRVLTIQDLSCVGKCALTAALPVISAMGVECCALPTALLSTHTAFRYVHFRDLTGEMRPIMDVWAQEQLSFDVICTGYLGSVEQAQLVGEVIDRFRGPDTRVIVDPVLGDGGVLYRGFDDAFVRAMRELIRRADVILPNATEAALLLERPYAEDPGPEAAQALLAGLVELGPAMAVLTGVREGANRVGAAGLEAGRAEGCLYTGPLLPGSYFGTGDIFAAVLSGALARGASLDEGLRLAVDFVAECIRCTLADEQRRFYGVSFEPALGMLTRWAGSRDVPDNDCAQNSRKGSQV